MTKMPDFFAEIERDLGERALERLFTSNVPAIPAIPEDPTMTGMPVTAAEHDLDTITEVLAGITPHLKGWARNPLLRELADHGLGMTLTPSQVASVCQIVHEIDLANTPAPLQVTE